MKILVNEIAIYFFPNDTYVYKKTINFIFRSNMLVQLVLFILQFKSSENHRFIE